MGLLLDSRNFLRDEGRFHAFHTLYADCKVSVCTELVDVPEERRMPGILSDITGGGAFAIVPADALADCTLSRDARWLYALLCGHADRTGLCRRSLRRLADEQGVSRRSLQRWLGELEEHGRVVRVNAEGKAGQFRVIRNPADLPTSRAIGVARTDERRVRYGEYGRRGVSSRHGTGDSPVTRSPVDKAAGGDRSVAGGVTAASPAPVTRLSPRTRPDSPRPVEHGGGAPSGRSWTAEERGEAQRRIEREQEIRRIVQDAFRSRFTGVVPVGDIVRERLTEQEIEQLVTGARPMTDLLAMLGRQPLANEADGRDTLQRGGGGEGIAPKCA